MFAEMFQTKILTLAPNAKIGPNVYNGMQKIQVEEKNFMSELKIRRAILSIIYIFILMLRGYCQRWSRHQIKNLDLNIRRKTACTFTFKKYANFFNQ